MSSGDPWSSGGESTRAEVREIFARHAAASDAAHTGAEPTARRTALPGMLRLPARGWRALSPAGKAIVALLAAGLVALVAVKLPPALENAAQNEINERRARAAQREEMRRTLIADQRPRRAVLRFQADPAPALAAAVAADAARRVAQGKLDGPLGETTCEPVARSDVDPRAPVFKCMVAKPVLGQYQGRDLLSGYRFRGRVELASGQAAWCKENPRPLHPDQEEFVVVPLSRACTD